MSESAVLPADEQPQDDSAAQCQPDRGRQAEPVRCSRFGLDEPPCSGAEDPEHDQPKSERRQSGPHQIELRSGLGRRVGDPAGEGENREHEQDLADEHPSPREIGRAQAADQRPCRDGDRARRGDQPVRPRPSRAREVGRDERDYRGQDQRRTHTLQERQPNINTPRLGEIAVMNDPEP